MAKTPEPAAPGNQLAVFGDQLTALDAFAESNNLLILTEGKGSFAAMLGVADAIGQLKIMLTPELMKPIMALQGTALGFKTDKDKDGGYAMEIVRDCLIEATLKGFKMVGNQSNIIAGRFYATKEGFEDFFLRQAKKGDFTDYRDAYSVPKFTREDEAVVNVTATWKWKGIADKFENVPISIRVNKGQGADATLGKAKRKILARIYSRVTGTVITEGEASEATVIDVASRTVAETAGATPGAAGASGPDKPTDEQKQLVKEICAPHADKANAWLLANNAILTGQTFLDVTAKTAAKIISKTPDFLKAIGAE